MQQAGGRFTRMLGEYNTQKAKKGNNSTIAATNGFNGHVARQQRIIITK